MAKTQLQIETEAHYAAWLAQRQQGINTARGARLEAIFARLEQVERLRSQYAAGQVDEAQVKAELRKVLDDLTSSIDFIYT